MAKVRGADRVSGAPNRSRPCIGREAHALTALCVFILERVPGFKWIAYLAALELRRQIVELGMVPAPNRSPEQLQDFINAEMLRWGKVVQQAGLAGSE
jgi:hypothetical protein